MRRKFATLMASAALCLGHASPATAAPAAPTVVDGKKVSANVFTWQVGILLRAPTQSRSDATIHCGGVLISPRHVLTAAHCVDSKSKEAQQREPFLAHPREQMSVVVNATNIRTDGTVHGVARIVVHPMWKKTGTYLNYDAAILELDGNVAGTPIRISRRLVEASLGSAWVSGWGVTESGAESSHLIAATVPIVDSNECVLDNDYGGRITNQMFCAGKKAGGPDSCSGDSGGPLVVGRLGATQLIGLVSWGHGCGAENNYGVYTRLSQMLRWIATETGRAAVFTSEQPGPLFTIPDDGEI